MRTLKENMLSGNTHPDDDLLTGITFQELIDAVYHNVENKSPVAVQKEFELILKDAVSDARFLLKKHMKDIIRLSSLDNDLNESINKRINENAGLLKKYGKQDPKITGKKLRVTSKKIIIDYNDFWNHYSVDNGYQTDYFKTFEDALTVAMGY